MRQYLTMVFNGFVIFGAILVCLISVGGFFPQIHWTLGWYSHPRPHFFLLSLLALVWLTWQKRWGWSAVPLLSLVLNGSLLAPFFLSGPQHAAAGQATLAIVHLNTNKGEADLRALDSFPADIIFLQEVTPELEARLGQELPDYQIALSHPLTTTQGIAMLVNKTSAIETSFHTIRNLPWYNYRPLITTKLELNRQRLHIMSLHTSRPHHNHADAFQGLEIDAAAEWGRIEQDFGHEVLMIGDLNLTPWSVRFKQFLQASHTQDSMLGFGIQNSWTMFWPMWLGLPIDHAVVSDGLVVIERATAPVAGSDHGLLFVRVATVKN